MDTTLAGYPDDAPAEEQIAWLRAKVQELAVEMREHIEALEARQADVERRMANAERRMEHQNRRIAMIEETLDAMRSGDPVAGLAAMDISPTRH